MLVHKAIFILIGCQISTSQLTLSQNGLSLPPINLYSVFRFAQNLFMSAIGGTSRSSDETSGIPVSEIPTGDENSIDSIIHKLNDSCKRKNLTCDGMSIDGKIKLTKQNLTNEQLLTVLRHDESVILAKESNLARTENIESEVPAEKQIGGLLAANGWITAYSLLSAGLLAGYASLATPYYFTGETVGGLPRLPDYDMDEEDMEEQEDETEGSGSGSGENEYENSGEGPFDESGSGSGEKEPESSYTSYENSGKEQKANVQEMEESSNMQDKGSGQNPEENMLFSSYSHYEHNGHQIKPGNVKKHIFHSSHRPKQFNHLKNGGIFHNKIKLQRPKPNHRPEISSYTFYFPGVPETSVWVAKKPKKKIPIEQRMPHLIQKPVSKFKNPAFPQKKTLSHKNKANDVKTPVASSYLSYRRRRDAKNSRANKGKEENSIKYTEGIRRNRIKNW